MKVKIRKKNKEQTISSCWLPGMDTEIEIHFKSKEIEEVSLLQVLSLNVLSHIRRPA
jgi:hypothetical protein